MDLANWAQRTSPKFTKGAKYKFHQGVIAYRNSSSKLTITNLPTFTVSKQWKN